MNRDDLKAKVYTPLPGPTGIERLEEGNWVSLTAVARAAMLDFLAEHADPTEDADLFDGFCDMEQDGLEAHDGLIEPARCLPMGTRLFHSDMGVLAECWKILDPIPSIGAVPGDLLFHCEGAHTHGRRRPEGSKVSCRWPTPFAVMDDGEWLYVAFLTEEHWAELLFPKKDQEQEAPHV